MRLPEGSALAEAERSLLKDARVTWVQRVGRVVGASQRDASALQPADLQWHLDEVGLPSGAADLSGLVVAVLDSGVAYEAHGGAYAADGLATVDVVAPYDFVDGDAHPEAAHVHGTHIASLIVSNGEAPGVAAGASLMPLKVLDEDNSGSEADLVDAIYWAVDYGADVINLSLVFPEGYSPSDELQAALEYAHDAEVLLVGAAGNDGDARALYPAASPLVLSVGATRTQRLFSWSWQAPARYSNRGGSVDLMAPGGDLEQDVDGDGYPDGLLAEGPPAADGAPVYYLYAGTSQSAALVSGAALQLMGAGVQSRDALVHALHMGAMGRYGAWTLYNGEGAGDLDIDAAITAAAQVAGQSDAPVYAMVMPYLTDEGASEATPRAWVSVVDEDGLALESDALVLVDAWGPEGHERLYCDYDAALGGCEVALDAAELEDSSGAELALGWGFAVDGVYLEDDGWLVRPRRGLFVSEGFVVLTEAMDLDGLLDQGALGVHWEEGEDDALGSLRTAFSVLDLGVGAATRPSGLLLTEALLDTLGTSESIDLDLDGTGLVTEPLGFTQLRRFSLDGSGLVTEPLGFTGTRLVFFKGSGLVTEPLGFHALDLFSVFGSGLVTEPLGFTGELLRLDEGGFVTQDLSSSAFGGLMSDGGLLLGQGEQAPAWFNGSGALLGEALSEGVLEVAGEGAEAL